jgi:hypothetical protein
MNEHKSKRGGRRPGAGRPRKPVVPDGAQPVPVVSLREATRRKQVALAERHELEVAVRRKELVERSAVVECWRGVFSVVRGRLLGLPVRLAAECAHREPGEVQAVAKRLVHEALTELANADGLPRQ